MHPGQIEGKYFEWLCASNQAVVPCQGEPVRKVAVWVRPPTTGGANWSQASFNRGDVLQGVWGARCMGQLAEHEPQA